MNLFGLLLCDDLIFSSRITATARATGLTVTPVRSADVLLQLAGEQLPACVIVDLANPGLDIEALTKVMKSTMPPPFLVAYGSHVDTATLKKAREAGCDLVLPRSKFVEELPKALTTWFGQTGA